MEFTSGLGLIKFLPFGFGADMDLPSLSLSNKPARVTTAEPRAGPAGARTTARATCLALEAREDRVPGVDRALGVDSADACMVFVSLDLAFAGKRAERFFSHSHTG